MSFSSLCQQNLVSLSEGGKDQLEGSKRRIDGLFMDSCSQLALLAPTIEPLSPVIMPSDAPVPLPPRVAALSGEKTRPRRRPVAAAAGKRRLVNQIPDDILHDAALNEAVSGKSPSETDEILLLICRMPSPAIQLLVRDPQDHSPITPRSDPNRGIADA